MNGPVDWTLYSHLLLALAIGLLIGLERGWSARAQPAGRRVAGLRTFGLIGLIGGMAGLMAVRGQLWVLPALGLGLAAILAVGYWLDARHDDDLSATTVVAGLLTFVLGAAAMLGLAHAAAAAAVISAMLLLLRQDLHAWTHALDEAEMRAVIRFLLIAVVVVPLLPDEGYGPYDALNPFTIGLMVVLLSGLSFAGYWATRALGTRRGLLLTAASGGLVSSTAVTYAFAHFSRSHEDAARPLAAGVVIASVIMLLRVLILLAVLSPALLGALAAALVAATLTGAAASWWLVRADGARPIPEKIVANPFDLGPALFFALVLAAMLVASRWASEALGDGGLFAVTAITALMDVDAVIVSLSRLPAQAVTIEVAGTALLLAVAVNTLIKPLVVGLLGARAMLLPTLLPILIMLAAGGAATLLMRAAHGG